MFLDVDIIIYLMEKLPQPRTERQIMRQLKTMEFDFQQYRKKKR